MRRGPRGRVRLRGRGTASPREREEWSDRYRSRSPRLRFCLLELGKHLCRVPLGQLGAGARPVTAVREGRCVRGTRSSSKAAAGQGAVSAPRGAALGRPHVLDRAAYGEKGGIATLQKFVSLESNKSFHHHFFMQLALV